MFAEIFAELCAIIPEKTLVKYHRDNDKIIDFPRYGDCVGPVRGETNRWRDVIDPDRPRRPCLLSWSTVSTADERLRNAGEGLPLVDEVDEVNVDIR